MTVLPLVGLLLFAARLFLQPASAVTYADVAEIFRDHCILCHRGPYAPRSLRLDSLAGIKTGSVNGPVAVAGRPEESELVKRLRGESLPRMPLNGPPYLDDDEIALIEAWIRDGLHGSEPDSQASRSTETPPASSDTVRFSDIAPVLASRCAKCHRDGGQMGRAPEQFRVLSYSTILATDERARVIPGNPEASELVRRIRGQSLPRMPFDGPPYLNDQQIALIEKWVSQGARDADGRPAPVPVGARVRLGGILTGYWEVDGLSIRTNGRTRIKKAPRIGGRVQVRGIVGPDGSITATRIRRR